jgi:hypothetical protein
VPGEMFVGNAKSQELSLELSTLKALHSDRLQPYSQRLGKAGKALAYY